jgi:hypothetical protein
MLKITAKWGRVPGKSERNGSTISGQHKLLVGDSLTSKSLFRQMPVCFQDQTHRLTQVLTGFGKGIPLSAGPRKLFDESNVSFRDLDKNRG